MAYVADDELLGRHRIAWKFVYQQGREGYVTQPGSGFNTPSAFYKRLRRFLDRLGYM